MKTGVRTSRSGRLLKQTEQDINSLPTEVAKFITKSSPRRKPKETIIEKDTTQEVVPENYQSPGENKENSSEFETTEMKQKPPLEQDEQVAMAPQSSAIESSEQEADANNESQSDEQENDGEVQPNIETNDNGLLLKFESDDDDNTNSGDRGKQDFSDTDSALGSGASCNDEFNAGQILWGAFSKMAWYPCMVYPDKDGNITIGKWQSVKIVENLY